jgi:hypothetical protein
LLIAEGDSWFDYPFFDTLERLEDAFGFEIESVAHKGDTVEGMAYDESQTQTLARVFEKVAGRGGQPRAILLSGGGNDIAGDELAIMLNHAASGLPPINDSVVQGVIDVRLKTALLTVVSGVDGAVAALFQPRGAVLIHGYARPVPDGRGYLGGGWILPGRGSSPASRRRATGRPGQLRADRRPHRPLQRHAADPPGDARPRPRHLRRPPAGVGHRPGGPYKKMWNDELHPTKPGFELVAGAFNKVIAGFAAPGAAAAVGRPRGRLVARRRGARSSGLQAGGHRPEWSSRDHHP